MDTETQSTVYSEIGLTLTETKYDSLKIVGPMFNSFFNNKDWDPL